MVMKQEMMKMMGELAERLKRLGCPALLNELTKFENSPNAIRELLDLAKRAEAEGASDNS